MEEKIMPRISIMLVVVKGEKENIVRNLLEEIELKVTQAV